MRGLEALVARARTSQLKWNEIGMDARIDVIRRVQSLLQSRKSTLSSLLSKEIGKPIAQANSEVSGTIDRIDYFINTAPSALSAQKVFDDGRRSEIIRYQPLGVIANISAWNYPYFVGSNVFIPALLAGNAVIYKPSEYTASTGAAIAEVMKDAGVPDGVFNLLNGDGKVGKELVNTKGIAGVFFTGSVATGKAIARETIGKGNLIRLQLELGGKDAVYVRDDIKDIDAVAAAVLDGAMYNNGQGCCSVERVYVHEKIYSAFTAALVKHAKAASVGDCSDNNAYITRLARGKVHVDALNAQVEDAVKKNGVLLCGGVQKGDGGVFLPTIVGNATSDMLVMKEESFGPIFGVAPVANDDEAIEKINDSDYGLTASVYTSSNESAEKILQAANVGIAYRNCCDSVSVRMPWTGRKDSGIGSTCGVDGIRAFCYTKSYYLR